MKHKIRQGDVFWLKRPIDKTSHIQGGDRPYVVVSKHNNLNLAQVCPMTKDLKEYPYCTEVFANL